MNGTGQQQIVNIVGLLLLAGCAQQVEPDPVGVARTAAEEGARIVEIGSGMHSVNGRLAGFDPANTSVIFALPPGPPGPLVLLIHGAGGMGDNANVIAAIRAAGIGVLAFDAYRMNSLERPSTFWVRNVTYEARQRMIFTTARAAYLWVINQPGIDARRIHLYGVSNGADVALNMAAIVEPAHVRTVFAEAPAGAGLGLPDRLAVPVRVIFGLLDNYAGQHVEDWRWKRTVPCRLNILWPDTPPGNAATCNRERGSSGRTQSPGDWAEEQRTRGADIETWFYEGGAHGMFLGPLRRQTMDWATGTMHASIGAEEATRRQLLADILTRIAAPH